MNNEYFTSCCEQTRKRLMELTVIRETRTTLTNIDCPPNNQNSPGTRLRSLCMRRWVPVPSPGLYPLGVPGPPQAPVLAQFHFSAPACSRPRLRPVSATALPLPLVVTMTAAVLSQKITNTKNVAGAEHSSQEQKEVSFSVWHFVFFYHCHHLLYSFYWVCLRI